MKKRKTVEIAYLISAANQFLANSPDSQKGERIGFFLAVSAALHESGNYRGFSYIEGKGIVRNAGPDGSHVFPDESRRQILL